MLSNVKYLNILVEYVEYLYGYCALGMVSYKAEKPYQVSQSRESGFK